ncbi:hypothetical protein MMC25_001833 [Agyrium rufum]|nr:hypothetical protein [Agyrium rufum]
MELDPWDWLPHDVAEALCGDNGWLTGSSEFTLDELKDLHHSIHQSRTSGRVLLMSDYARRLAMLSLPMPCHESVVEIAIESLRSSSSGYYEWCRNRARNTAVLTWSGQDEWHPQALQRLSATPNHLPVSLTPISQRTPNANMQPALIEPPQRLPIVPPLRLENEAPRTITDVLDLDAVGLAVEFRDERRRRRRRLELQPINVGPNENLLTGDGHMQAVPILNESPLPTVIRDDGRFEQVSTNAEPATTNIKDPANSDEEDSILGDIPQMLQDPKDSVEPGTLYRDDKDQKRIKPIPILESTAHVPQLHSGGLEQDDLPSLIAEAKDNSSSPNHMVQGIHQPSTSDRHWLVTSRPLKSYAGTYGISPEILFYGKCEVGHEVKQDESKNVYKVSFDEKILRLNEEGDTNLEFAFTTVNYFPSGQRRFVAGMMKSYLRDRGNRKIVRQGKRLQGFIPYQQQLAREHDRPSMSIIIRNEVGLCHLRVDRQIWSKYQVSEEQFNATEEEAILGNLSLRLDERTSILDKIGITHQVDYEAIGKRWSADNHNNFELPTYGDSGSDGEFDIDTWEEIEKETGQLERPILQSKSKNLSTSEVSKAIDEATMEMTQRWHEKELPKLQAKARSWWLKAHRKNFKTFEKERLTSKTEKLTDRQSKLMKSLHDEFWSTEKQLKKQCACLEPTIYDIHAALFCKAVLENKHKPPKVFAPPKIEKKRASKKVKDQLGGDEEDIELTSQDEESDGASLGDFIVDDDTEHTSNMVSEAVAQDCDHIMDAAFGGLNDDADHDTDVASEGAAADMSFVRANASSARSQGLHAAARDGDDLPVKDYLHYDNLDLTTTDAIPESSPLSSLSSKSFESRGMSPASVYDLALLNAGEDETKTRTDVFTAHDDEDIGKLRGKTVQSERQSFFIDLTQMSDPPEPNLPSSTRPRRKVSTPPIFHRDDLDPFPSSSRSIPPFRTPDDIDIIEPKDGPIIKEEPVRSKILKLPDQSNIQGIKNLKVNLLLERNDRSRLLVWIIMHMGIRHRLGIFRLYKTESREIMQAAVTDCLESMLKNHASVPRRLKPFEGDEDRGDLYMRVSFLYISWSQCVLLSAEQGIKKDYIAWTQAQGTDQYIKFHECLGRCREDWRKGLPKTSLDKTISSQKRERIDYGDDVQAPRSSKKQRIYAVQESQEAKQAQSRARQRVDDQAKRAKEMQKKLAKVRGTEDGQLKIINTAAGEGADPILLNEAIASRIQPHQVEGVQFLWREVVVAGNDSGGTSNEGGCLLAHTMGLGKTMQVITFIVAIAEASVSSNENIKTQIPADLQERRTLILCPSGLVDNWHDELLMWIPESSTSCVGSIRKISSELSMEERLYDIQEWSENRGILLLGYPLFRSLVDNRTSKAGNAKLTEEQHNMMKECLLEKPTLIVADEAHILKASNIKSKISKIMVQLSAKRRIALTGSPLSNNLEEYYAVINWIAPEFLGPVKEFNFNFLEPIQQGLYANSKQPAQRKSIKKLAVLTKTLEPKVNRADISVLDKTLSKTDFEIFVPLTEIQKTIYSHYVKSIPKYSEDLTVSTIFAVVSVFLLICNHPVCFRDHLKAKRIANHQAARDENLIGEPDDHEGNAETFADTYDKEAQDILEEAAERVGLNEGFVDQELALIESIAENIESTVLSNKMKILMTILEHSKKADDKVLIFSHSLLTLNYIERQLRISCLPYDRIDGKTKMSHRNQLTKTFNTETTFRISLISTRAGGQGLNFFGANRVVIIDQKWNPAHEEQAVGRAYRMGQRKHVYIYRLMVGGTYEETLRNQSIFKKHLAVRAIDRKQPERYASSIMSEYLKDFRELEMVDLTQFKGQDPMVLDQLLEDSTLSGCISSITLTDTFQRDKPEELTAEEKVEVDEHISLESLRRTDPTLYRKRRQEVDGRAMRSTVTRDNAGPGPSVPHMSTPLPNLTAKASGNIPPQKIGGQTYSHPPRTSTFLQALIPRGSEIDNNLITDSTEEVITPEFRTIYQEGIEQHFISMLSSISWTKTPEKLQLCRDAAVRVEYAITVGLGKDSGKAVYLKTINSTLFGISKNPERFRNILELESRQKKPPGGSVTSMDPQKSSDEISKLQKRDLAALAQKHNKYTPHPNGSPLTPLAEGSTRSRSPTPSLRYASLHGLLEREGDRQT